MQRLGSIMLGEDYDNDNSREIHDEIANQEWTKTSRAINIPPFSGENSGPTNILHANQIELNLFGLLFTEINLYV